MNRYSHGGDIYSRHVEHDFSANINPLGLHESIVSAAAEALSRCESYPDPNCRELTAAISSQEGVPAENIVCGNGAADLIYRIVSALKPRTSLLCAPTFSEYEKALKEHGCTVKKHYLKRENCFALTEEILGDITANTDILFLCTPNNPTGITIPRELMRRISEKCSETGTFLVVDECFLDFVENGAELSAKPLLNEKSVVLKAFTKMYAMAGMRLGYAIFGSEKTAAKAAETGQAWSVSTPAQAAGIAALKLNGYAEKTSKIISGERDYLSAGLRSMGFEIIPSEANFILFRCGVPLDKMLIQRGIAIRNCGNYDVPGSGWYRTAVRLRGENELLLAAIRDVLKG